MATTTSSSISVKPIEQALVPPRVKSAPDIRSFPYGRLASRRTNPTEFVALSSSRTRTVSTPASVAVTDSCTCEGPPAQAAPVRFVA